MAIKPKSKRAVLLLAALSSAVWLLPAVALETRTGGDIVIGAGEVIADDLIVFAETVTVEGTIQGDLVASGAMVTVNGTVEGDLLAAAQAVVINGTVGDDARIAGMVLEINGEVGDDVLAAGLSLQTGEGSRIGGAASYTGLQALWKGTVVQDLTVNANGFEFRGQVGGNLDAEVGPPGDVPGIRQIPSPVPIPTVGGGLTVGQAASVGGDLEYTGPVAAVLPPGAEIGGETIYEQSASQDAGTRFSSRLRRGLGRWLALLAVGSLFLWLAPAWSKRITDALSSSPQRSLAVGVGGIVGSGVLLLLVLAIAILFSVLVGLVGLGSLGTAAVILGALFDGFVVGALILALLYLAQIAVGMTAGKWILDRFQSQPSRYLALLVGALVYVVLRQVPFLGFLVGILVLLLGFGALILAAFRGRRAPAAPAASSGW